MIELILLSLVTLIKIVIGAAATYGASKLLVEYEGFAGIFYKLRQVKWLEMLICVVCTAVFIAIPVAIYSGLDFVGYLAILGIIIFLERI